MHQNQVPRKLFLRFFHLLLIAILVALSGATSANHVARANSTNDEIKVVLNKYSAYLQSGKTSSPDYFSSDIDKLVKDRQDYYHKFFNTALNSKLVDVSSVYVVENSVITAQDSSTMTVSVFEEITFTGKAKTKSVDEYPTIKAAKLAAKLADERLKDEKKNAAVKKELSAYLDSVTGEIDKSVKENYEMTSIVKHEIIFSLNSGLKIIQDSFSDQAKDNVEGADIVYWVDGKFYRTEPDMKSFPDYIIQNTPIEDLAENFLTEINVNTVNSAVSELLTETISYNRTAAKNYANTWVRNTSYTCATTPKFIYQNDDYYNYSRYRTEHCNDCTNFVSQALKAGGMPRDSAWKPGINNLSMGTYAWVNTAYLMNYLIQKGRGTAYSSSPSTLTIGDLVFIHDINPPDGIYWRHVGMIVSLNPFRYSAHASDRRSIYLTLDFNVFLHMKDTIELTGDEILDDF